MQQTMIGLNFIHKILDQALRLDQGKQYTEFIGMGFSSTVLRYQFSNCNILSTTASSSAPYQCISGSFLNQVICRLA